MVERPIKKSERQAVAKPDDVGEAIETQPSMIEDAQDSITQPPEERSTSRPLPGKDKRKGSREDRQKDERSSRTPINPALMRGPKPTKIKPPVVKETQEATAEESVPEADPEEI